MITLTLLDLIVIGVGLILGGIALILAEPYL